MNKAIKSVFLVLGIGAFLQVSGVVSYATWTGAENGYWTNANNWVDGQVGGRWFAKDAGGHVVTNGALGCTVYFDENGASGATTINFDGVCSASNIIVRGGSAAPRYTFGTSSTQILPIEAVPGSSLNQFTVDASVTRAPIIRAIFGFGNGIGEAGGNTSVYLYNNSADTVVINDFG